MTVGEAEDAGIPTDIPAVQLQTLETAQLYSVQSVRAATIIQDLIKESPESVGLSGAASKAVNSVVAQTKAFLKIAGIDFIGSLDPKDHKDTFRDIGITSARLQSIYIGLAYAAAAASQGGAGGRTISDRDIDLQLRRLGGDFQDPVASIAVLEDFKEEVDFVFRTRMSIISGREPPSLLKRPDIDESKLTREDILRMVPDDLVRINPNNLTAEGKKWLDEALTALGI